MTNQIKERVQARLKALGINPFEAARRANLERSYVNDLLIGKKTTVRASKLPALAEALECDAAYLQGFQAAPVAGTTFQGSSLSLSGIVEKNTWRKASAFRHDEKAIPLSPDPRYPVHDQAAYLVRGDDFSDLGIADGSILVVLTGVEHVRDGDLVITRRRRAEEVELEYSVEVVSASAQSARASTADPNAEIVGLVLSAHRVFS